MAKLALRKLESSIWLDEFPVDILYLFSLRGNERCAFFSKKIILL